MVCGAVWVDPLGSCGSTVATDCTVLWVELGEGQRPPPTVSNEEAKHESKHESKHEGKSDHYDGNLDLPKLKTRGIFGLRCIILWMQ